MILRARQEKDIVVFELEGFLDFESTQRFEETCISIIEKIKAERVVFNMQKLRFVGSSGINQFVQAMKEFNSLSAKSHLCHVSSEFHKILRSLQTSRKPFHIFEDEGSAIDGFQMDLVTTAPIRKTSNRKKRAQ